MLGGSLAVDLLETHHQLGPQPVHGVDDAGHDGLRDVVVQHVPEHRNVRERLEISWTVSSARVSNKQSWHLGTTNYRYKPIIGGFSELLNRFIITRQ